ncbi:long-chain-fatty-acid--CoA ligase [Rhodococcus koreensis]|jgi:acyl-CoA synthetase (AMP-forming)/AMP-acid ligase II|uniref:long-chain-fatty-acid--CoA ligase n=1 Tax=Rhodococcus koreensis TaxID=99653 RepID=UPI001981D724|nr:long-chain-fatty-acid--CoA ligase [Rhodococcus koreensis]QSE84837.1 long-chain-fatty-acid--CoA ligase [Rhodococcus koreensis]
MASPILHVFDPITHWTSRDPARIAIRFQDQSWTWQQLSERVRRNAAAQLVLGLAAGDRVAFLDKNHPASLETTLGCAVAGTVNAVLNFRLAPSELAYVINDCRAELLILGAEFTGVVESIRADLEYVRTIVVLGGEHDEYESWLDSAPSDVPAHRADPTDCFLQLYTSGTTGHPKGAMLTHRSVGAHSESASTAFGFDRDSVNMVAMPLFHVGGTSWALAAMSQGAETILVREVVPALVLKQITDQAVTHAFFVPAVIRFLLQIPGVSGQDLASLRCLGYGGSPIPEALLREAMNTFGVDFYQVYGMTEASGVFCVLPPADHRDPAHPERLHAAGWPVDGVEVRVVDPVTGEELPDGTVGEFQIRGAQVMSGYWQRDADTAACFEGEWFKTGDAGRRDTDGYFYVEDRVKDVIISGGENIYPAEVERVISEYPDVAEVAVIGIPDDKWGESVRAVVVARNGSEIDTDTLLEYCAQHLAGYKRPRSIEIIPALPRNATGKILKRDLRAPHWAGRSRAL